MLKKLKKAPVASELVPKKRGVKSNTKRLTQLQEELVEEIIRSKHLTKQKPYASKSYLHLIERCDRVIVDVPSESTFRRRIEKISKSENQLNRMYASERRSKHSPKTCHYTSTAPMALVQIDHTPLNAILISSINGKILGRVVITVITCIHTRMVLGFHIGIYGPDHESVALALAHACFDKTEYLENLGLKGVWHSLGIPEALLMDNTKEFKSRALKYGCGEFGIEMQYRPVGTPHYGGHVESLIKTINENLRNIPGATFANIQERGDYPSEKLACFTLPMIDKHITNFIVNYYHKRPHSKIGVSPIQKYEEAVQKGFIPRNPAKPKPRFIADFTESHMRTLRDIGIEFECKEYWSPELAALYNHNCKQVRVLPISNTVKYVNILGPDDVLYKVPAKNLSLPDVTRREWKRYRKIVVERNNARKMTNREIAHYIRLENKIEKDAKRESRRLRRANESQVLAREKTPRITPPQYRNNDNVSFDAGAKFKTFNRGQINDGS